MGAALLLNGAFDCYSNNIIDDDGGLDGDDEGDDETWGTIALFSCNP